MKKLFTLFLLFATFSLHAQLPDGSIAPDWTATDIDDNEWNLYEILAAGKTVVMEFTATWNDESFQYHEAGGLSEFYNQYGPGGLDEAMVFFVEGDDSTDASDLDGTGGNTVGNWLDNTPYPIIDDAEWLVDLYEAYGYPNYLMICPNRLLSEVGLASTFSLSQLSEACLVPTGENNAGVYLYVGFEGDFCESQTFAPSLIWQNIGSENITSATFELYLDGNLEQSIPWTGDLEPYAIDPQAFSAVTVTENSTIEMLIADVNGTNDDDDSNNNWQIEATVAPMTDQNFLTVEITTDDYPGEIFWEIRDANGTVFHSGGNPGVFDQIILPGAYTENNTTYTHETPLPMDGCYEFIIYDAYGDGICCGNGLGDYRLSAPVTGVLFQGGLFTDQDVRPFSLSGATTIDNDAAIFDYDGPMGDVCGEQNFGPIVTLRNQGAAELTMVELGISVGADLIQVFPHATSLVPGETEVVQMDVINVDSTTELIISVLSVNGGQDIIPAGNTVTAEITRRLTTTPPLTLEIQTDEWGYEIYWEMRSLTGNVVASGGNEVVGPDGGGLRVATEDDPGAYPQFSLLTENILLPDGVNDCYELLMVDDWGDGLSGGGFFKLYTESGELILNTDWPTGEYDSYLVDAQLAPSSVENLLSINELHVFPNPVSDEMLVSFSLSQNMDLGMGIYDVFGKKITDISKGNYSSGEHSFSVDMSGLVSGVYFLRGYNQNTELTKTVIKK